MEQLTGSKLGKEYNNAVYCHFVYLTYMQNTSCKNAGLDESQAGTKTVISTASDIHEGKREE